MANKDFQRKNMMNILLLISLYYMLPYRNTVTNIILLFIYETQML